METGIAIKDNLQPIAASPQQQVDRAAEMAKVLQGVVKQANLSRKFGGQKEHLFFEAWLTLGRFFNCTVATEWTRPVCNLAGDMNGILGWESKVNVLNADGQIIGCAESMCMRDEPNWKGKPNYALRSMAQTRAGGKALRSVFAWVAVLAGYSGTPAEEMDEEFNKDAMAEKPKAEHSESNLDTPVAMTDKQRGKLWALMKSEKELSDTEARTFMAWVQARPESQVMDITKDGKAMKVLSMKSASNFIENFDKLFDEFTKG